MLSYTLDNLKVNPDQDFLYDIFKNTVVDKKIPRRTTVVQEGEEMRLDLVSKRLYGTTEYVEELMILNNILNPWSIKKQDSIVFLDYQSISLLQDLEIDEEITSEKSAKPNKNTRVDANRNKGVIPTIKPINLKQLEVDKTSEKIKINNKLT